MNEMTINNISVKTILFSIMTMGLMIITTLFSVFRIKKTLKTKKLI